MAVYNTVHWKVKLEPRGQPSTLTSLLQGNRVRVAP